MGGARSPWPLPRGQGREFREPYDERHEAGPGLTDRIDRAVLWGASGQAKVLREILAHDGIRLVALFDDTPGLASPFPDVPLHQGEEGFRSWSSVADDLTTTGALVAIGGEHGVERLRLQRRFAAAGLRLLVAVHPTAFVGSGARIGAGSQVLAQAAVCVDVRLGEACIVNTSASVDHESVVGDGVHVAPGARVAGVVTIGDFVMVGGGAVVLPRVHIGTGAVIGAGAVVIRDVEPWTVVAGVPARVIGGRDPRRP